MQNDSFVGGLSNFANLFRQTPEMVCILGGPEHRFEFVNAAHIRALGFDATGKTVREAQPESVEVHGILDEVFRTGTTAELVEIPVTLGDRIRYFNLTYAARKDRQNRTDGIMVLGSEVTEQVLARRAQEDQRRWLESALNRLPSATFFVDPTSKLITFQNDAAKRLLGAGVTGMTPDQRHRHGYLETSRDGVPLGADEIPSVRAARGENLRDFTFDLKTPTGDYHLSASSDLIPEEFGQPATALLILTDLTAQKQIQDLLRKSEEQLSLALSTSRVGFYDWNIPDDVITFSPQMRADWGMPPEKMERRSLESVVELIHPDDREKVQELIRASIANREPYHLEYRVVHPGGKTVWLDVRGHVHYAPDGTPVRFFGTSVDISERKAHDRDLRALADSMPQVVWTAGPDGALDYTNARWTEYSGSSDPSAWLDFVYPGDRERAMERWIHSVTTREAYEIEFRLLRKTDSAHRWHLVRADAVIDEAGRVARWIGTCTDIEDQKRSEEILRQANMAAQAANAAKTAFLANMSHEIRTPLGAILGFVGLMRNPKATKQTIDGYLSVVQRNSDHLLRIIDDILDLSKVEAGQMVIEHIDFSLPDVLADFSSFMGMQARERGVAFRLAAGTSIPAVVESDPTRIRQILTNVVGNALKFTERGEVRLDVEYNAPYLAFRVTDSGIGISEENQEKLFQAFSQGDTSVTRKFGGTGLGLILTRSLCEMMGGDFRLVESRPGVGSVFEATVRVKVPPGTAIVSADDSFGALAPIEVANVEGELRGLRILVVEDLPDNQTLLHILLTEAGAEVAIANDGEEGVRRALEERFDVVLMDIQMPKMDGHSAAQELRRRGYAGPLIALTAHAMKEEREQAVQSGFTAFLSKPVVRDLLIDALSSYVDASVIDGPVGNDPVVDGPAKEETSAKPIAPVSVIIVEDDADLRLSLVEFLALDGFRVLAFAQAEEALTAIDRSSGPVVVFTDLSLQGMSGDVFVGRLNDRPDRKRFHVVVVSGWDDLAQRAREMGADAHLRKPFGLEKVSRLLLKFSGSHLG